MKAKTAEMIVCDVVDEGDRLLLYGNDRRYHVIAPVYCTVKLGDWIVYEPYGANFGWFVSIVQAPAGGEG